MDPLTPPTTLQVGRRWSRHTELAWASRYMAGLVGVVIGIFFFGIFYGLGGQTDDERRAVSLGIAGGFAICGWVLMRAIRRRFAAAGIPPEKVERSIPAMLGVLGVVMVCLGIGGLLYIASPFDPTPLRWTLRLEPLANQEALTAGCVAYILSGLFLAIRGIRARRG